MHTALALALAFAAFQDTAPKIGSDVWRHELGRRLAAMERAFGAADEELRVAALPHVERAVTAFFGGGFDRASAAIDEARRVLVPLAIDDETARLGLEAQRAFGDRLALVPTRRVVAEGAASVGLDVLALYGDATIPEGVTWRVSARVSGVEGAEATAFGGDATLPARDELATLSLPAGDHVLQFAVFERDRPLRSTDVAFSVVADLDARLAKLEASVGDKKSIERTVAAHTAHHLFELLEELAGGDVPEVDLAANALLTQAETLAFGDEAARSGLLAAPGDRYMALPLERGTAIGRLFVPEGIEPGRDVPLVLALHGAGGSENMFFATYGAGLAVDLARERGWILFAPRVGPLGYTLDGTLAALDALLPIDRDNVFVVGHSMGAAATVGAVAKSPALVRAYAALGGGGRASTALIEVPGFVAAGASDFGKRGADALAQGLRTLGASIDARTYADTEHLLIVQRALPDVFAFFDAHVRTNAAASEAPAAGSGG